LTVLAQPLLRTIWSESDGYQALHLWHDQQRLEDLQPGTQISRPRPLPNLLAKRRQKDSQIPLIALQLFLAATRSWLRATSPIHFVR
jgi:hypothetical protein